MIRFETRWRENWPAIYDWWIDHFPQITIHPSDDERNHDSGYPFVANRVAILQIQDWRDRFHRYDWQSLAFAFNENACRPLGMPTGFEIYGPDDLLVEFQLKF